MILEAVVCPDCGELTVRNIQIDEFGTPVWACQKCGVVHEDGAGIGVLARRRQRTSSTPGSRGDCFCSIPELKSSESTMKPATLGRRSFLAGWSVWSGLSEIGRRANERR